MNITPIGISNLIELNYGLGGVAGNMDLGDLRLGGKPDFSARARIAFGGRKEETDGPD